MTRPSFFEGVVVALGASVAASVASTALAWAFPGGWVLRLLTAALGLGYVLYLLTRSGQRIGRPTALAGWAVAAGALWLLDPPVTAYVLAHLGLVWLIRSLYFHASVLAALTDLGLTGAGLAAGIWAALQSGSVFLTVWCFFLLQALFVAIPPRLPRRAEEGRADAEDPFDRAHRAAQAALRRLTQ